MKVAESSEISILIYLRSLFTECGYKTIDNTEEIGHFSSIYQNIGRIIYEIEGTYGLKYHSSILRMSITELSIDIAKKMNSTSNSSNSMKPNTISRKLNLVVVGRAGVGKSSFLNYAAGQNVFKTGVGDPVTQSYFDVIKIEKPQKNVTYALHDTKGLEAGKTEEWEKAIFSEIEKRDKSDDIYDWFHTIIFCIDSSAKRIQPFEIEAIKKLQQNNSVLVLLTKKDLVSADILEGLKSQLKQEIGDKIQVLSVCNVSNRTRKGESKASGLEDVLRVSFLGLWEKASAMLPYRAIKPLVEINKTLFLDRDLADLCAFSTLVLWQHPDEREEFKEMVSAWDLAYILKKDGYALIGKQKDIPLSDFREIAKLADVRVWSPGTPNRVIIDIVKSPFPQLLTTPSHLNHDFLDSWHYCMGAHTYIGMINELFHTLINNIINGVELLKKNVGKNGEIIAEILKFYNDVNDTHQKPIFNHKTEEAIEDLRNTDFEKMKTDFAKKVLSVSHALKEVNNCLFSSGSERREAEREYKRFHEQSAAMVKELEEKFNCFLTAYEAELHSYGQYCIREDEFSKDSSENNTQHENENIALLKKMIKIALSDGVISSKERMMLSTYAEKYGVLNDELDRMIIVERNSKTGFF